jgi:hypothetical protein
MAGNGNWVGSSHFPHSEGKIGVKSKTLNICARQRPRSYQVSGSSEEQGAKSKGTSVIVRSDLWSENQRSEDRDRKSEV